MNNKVRRRHSLRTISDLARHLGCSEEYLSELVEELKANESRLYRRQVMKKRSCGTRALDVPCDKLKQAQSLINAKILQKTSIHKGAVGAVKGKKLTDNLKPHVKKRMVGVFDLKNFFPSIGHRRVYETYVRMGASPNVARILTRLSTFKGKIPQGAPTSPMLANMVAAYGDKTSLYERLDGLAERHDSVMTGWVDDFTISGPAHVRDLESTVEKIVRQSGFRLNRSKTEFASSNERQVVTGHVVNTKPNRKKDDLRRLRSELYRCRTQGPGSVAEGPIHEYRARLLGRLNHVRSVNLEMGEKLMRDYFLIRWPDDHDSV